MPSDSAVQYNNAKLKDEHNDAQEASVVRTCPCCKHKGPNFKVSFDSRSTQGYENWEGQCPNCCIKRDIREFDIDQDTL